MAPYTNLDGTTPDQGLLALLKWQIERPRFRRDPFVPPRRANDGKALREERASLTWIGHATMVQKLGGKVIATDPIWSSRIQRVIPRIAPPGSENANVRFVLNCGDAARITEKSSAS